LEYSLVCDVNVYIDACDYIEKAGELPATTWPATTSNARRAAAMVFGWFLTPPPGVTINLYGDSQLDRITVYKLGDALGWSTYQIDTWLTKSLLTSLDATDRTIELDPPAPEEPLIGSDFEDRRIYGLFHAAKADQPTNIPLLVTADREFALLVNADAPTGLLGGPLWLAMSPIKFCELMSGQPALGLEA
jgi:hypothetical protein